MPKTSLDRLAAGLVAAMLGLCLPVGHAGAEEAPPAAEAPGSEEPRAPEIAATDDTMDWSYTEQVVVTASRATSTLLDAPVATSIITPDRLETSPADSFADVLRGVPGLNVIQMSSRDVNVTARGATGAFSNRQLLLLDGHPVMAASAGIGLWDLLPVNLDEVGSVEIVRGPTSSTWGSSALAAVVNVRTRSPREDPGGRISGGAGELGSTNLAARWAEAFERGSYAFSASQYQQDAFDRPDALPDGTPVPPGYGFDSRGTDQSRANLRFDWDSAENRHWSFRAGHARSSGAIYSQLGPYYYPSMTRDVAEITFEGSSVSAHLWWDGFDGRAENMLSGEPNVFTHDTFSGEVSARRAIGERHFVAFGGSTGLDLFSLEAAPADDSRQQSAIFVEDFISLGRKVSLDLAVRGDHFSTVGTTVSPRVTILVQPAPKQSLRFGWSQAFRAPTLIESFVHVDAASVVPLPSGPFVFPLFVRGGKSLSVEESESLEIGWTGEVSERHGLSASVYRTEIGDIIDFYPAEFWTSSDPPPGWPEDPALLDVYGLPKTMTYRNVGRIRQDGVEVSLSSSWSRRVSTTLSATWQAGPEFLENDAVIPIRANVPPAWTFGTSLVYTGDKVKGSVTVDYVDDAFWSDVLDSRFWGGTPAYTLVSTGWRFALPHDCELAFDVTNLLDERIQQHVFGDIISRKASISVTWRFGS